MAAESASGDGGARPAGRPPGKTGWRASPVGEYLSEFLGTFTLIVFGCGVVAMAVAALPQSGRTEAPFVAGGDWLLITLGWGLAVVFGVYVAGGVSGAHINPAVTLAFALRRGFPWSKVPGYVISQVAGAFVGAALVFGVYVQAINAQNAADGVPREGSSTVGIFVTGPADYFTTYWGPILTEVVGTAFLILIILALIDLLNTPPRANLGPVVIGLVVVGIGTSLGANTGYAINPARDFGPRVFAWLAGWGDVALPGKQGNLGAYWWVPIVAPLIGAVIGAIVYDIGVNSILKARAAMATTDVHVKGEVVEED